jgi:hypothetical protein
MLVVVVQVVELVRTGTLQRSLAQVLAAREILAVLLIAQHSGMAQFGFSQVEVVAVERPLLALLLPA